MDREPFDEQQQTFDEGWFSHVGTKWVLGQSHRK